MRRRILHGFILVVTTLLSSAQQLPVFEFTKGASGWAAAHDLEALRQTPEGLVARITGGDPYLHGPARDYPAGQALWMNMRVKSERGGGAQIFYFTGGATEEKSVRFYVPAGDFVDLRMPFPALEPKTRLRIDPPGTSGTCVIQKISFEARSIPVEPKWAQPVKPELGSDAATFGYGEVRLKHGKRFGAFEIAVGDKSVAIGNSRSMIGYAAEKETRWIEVTNAATLKRGPFDLEARVEFTDPDGGHWDLLQRFMLMQGGGGFETHTVVTVDADRDVVFLPMLTLLPGVGSFGTNKTQGVFAGVEFLENEPSSSEADVIGPGARRKVPDAMKPTFPLMAIAANGNYVALTWERDPRFCALFDSPDRTFKAVGHAMGILFPGANPAEREDGSILPYGGARLRKGEGMILKASIFAGRGETTIPAVMDYVMRRGLPKLTNTGYSAEEYFTLESHGWLDSKIRDGAKFRHAVGNGFGSAPVADGPMWMDWLAEKTRDVDLAARLKDTAKAALALVPPPAYNSAAVGHVRHPAEALIYGAVPENVNTALVEGRGQLGAFKADGSVTYSAPARGNDLAKTHWTREANGLAATHVSAVLERAAFSGDRELIKEGIRLLHALDKFHGTVPRGAQTWEVPLHTPDILASAYLVRAYLMGYELTGDAALLEEAKYWAWTGLPFIYLVQPTDGKVGVYSTTPVFGATQWVAPNWIGLPVQWCGLVYGDAIRRLARFAPKGPWLQLANGIAAAGVQHTHPTSEPEFQGLLPDSFDLRAQNRNPVPINPATLLPEAIQAYGEAPLYDFWSFREHGILVHAPGPIANPREKGNEIQFDVSSWSKNPWRLLLNGVPKNARLKVNGNDAAVEARTENGVVLKLTAASKVRIEFPAF